MAARYPEEGDDIRKDDAMRERAPSFWSAERLAVLLLLAISVTACGEDAVDPAIQGDCELDTSFLDRCTLQ
jgi:hypothetical protein